MSLSDITYSSRFAPVIFDCPTKKDEPSEHWFWLFWSVLHNRLWTTSLFPCRVVIFHVTNIISIHVFFDWTAHYVGTDICEVHNSVLVNPTKIFYVFQPHEQCKHFYNMNSYYCKNCMYNESKGNGYFLFWSFNKSELDDLLWRNFNNITNITRKYNYENIENKPKFKEAWLIILMD